MIFIYIIVAIATIFTSIKLSNCVDKLDKATNLSGAFIGGILLATITSLPEFITSLSSIIIFDNPEVVLGNILGSNIFNILLSLFLIIIFYNLFKKSFISKNHNKIIYVTIICYIIMIVALKTNNPLNILNISFYSFIIFILYILAMIILSKNQDKTKEIHTIKKVKSFEEKKNIKKILILFSFYSFILVTLGVILSTLTDKLAITYNLDASLSGALFLGIATSLPEATSCINLCRLGNFDASIGNIVGSNIFNLFILFVADIFYNGKTIYITSSLTNYLNYFGITLLLILLFIINAKNKKKNNVK